MYGEYLHDGLGAMPGARYVGESLRIPPPSAVTGTSQGGTIKALYGVSPRIPQLLFGRTPLWEVEGHQVDQFYDVRGNSGLGQVASYNPGRGGERWNGAAVPVKPPSPSSAASAEVPAAEGLGLSPLLLAAAAVAAYMFFSRAR